MSFWKRKNEKIECTAIRNTFPRHVARDSSRSNLRQFRKTVHNFRKILFGNIIGGHGAETTLSKWCPGPWIFRKSMMFTRSQHPQNQKLCGKRSISTQKLPTKKNVVFSKIEKSQYFWDFSTRQNPKIRDLADPGMCPYLPLASGHSLYAIVGETPKSKVNSSLVHDST